jgi:hypothetical protein
VNKTVFFKGIIGNLFKGKIASVRDLKYYKRWQYYLGPNRSSVIDRLPWTNFPSIDLFKKILKPTDIVFEYGGGGSTLFFLDRVKKVVTVEHNIEWYDILKNNLTQEEQLKWEGNLITAEPATESRQLDMSNPNDYSSSGEIYRNETFKNYVTYIDRFEDEYFDLILVDGRARPSCIKHSVNKVKKNGLLILDNADREYYLTQVESYLQNFILLQNDLAPIPFVPHFVQTNIYKRIK